ncbi:hypothetical protein [Rhodanobacter sp. DHB23]|uniref:hypothetical protein n=1 Tax=Rhodanobacter sp. DHB23 TaxID=2775923 RepID=UPI001785733D|nr:hypothetical protein [Rhodanobacter sp. DHB23]MBD8871274.1 hypothetical protein [Rhodanobacter sp. DHB23]
MNIRIAIAALAAAVLAACASTPMDHDALRQHAGRHCRVQATVSPVYAIGSTGTDMRNIAYVRCMRSTASPKTEA